MYVSTITAAIIFLAFLGYFAFQLAKNFQLRNLNVSLQNKDYETTEQLGHLPRVRRLLGDYVCDLYQLRAYDLAHDTEKMEQQLHKMLQATYKNPEDKKSFLMEYYHMFLLKGQRTYADWLLAEIRTLENPQDTKYQEQAYEVLLNGRSDLIEEMIDEINSKKYYGFSLGVILFAIAKQYESRKDAKNAEIYYQNAKVCFHPSAVYVPVIDKNLERLAAELAAAPA